MERAAPRPLPEGIHLELQNAVIVDGVRSAFGRGGRGKLVATRLDETGAQVVRALLERNPKVTGDMIEDIGLGQRRWARRTGRHRRRAPSRVSPASRPRSARSTATASAARAWRRCTASPSRSWSARPSAASRSASSAWAASSAAAAARARPNRITEFNKRRLESDAGAAQHGARTTSKSSASRSRTTSSTAPPVLSMTQTAQNVAEVYGLTREELDEFAVESHNRRPSPRTRRASTRTRSIPLEVEDAGLRQERQLGRDEHGKKIIFEVDECLRPGTNMEALGQLPSRSGGIAALRRQGDCASPRATPARRTTASAPRSS